MLILLILCAGVLRHVVFARLIRFSLYTGGFKVYEMNASATRISIIAEMRSVSVYKGN